MQEDLAAMKKTKESEIAELRSKKERLVHNFNLLHEATKEEIALIDQQIAKAAEGLYHLESMRTGRGGAAPKPAPASPAQEAARTAAASPASPARAASATRIETLEREGKERHVWEDGRHKVFDSDGRLLLDEEDKPDFQVEVPAGAARTKHVATWQGEGHPEWSPADEIDEQGRRHVVKGGRHRTYGQDGRLLSDEAEAAPEPTGEARANGAP
jgi:hypothetical protein